MSEHASPKKPRRRCSHQSGRSLRKVGSRPRSGGSTGFTYVDMRGKAAAGRTEPLTRRGTARLRRYQRDRRMESRVFGYPRLVVRGREVAAGSSSGSDGGCGSGVGGGGSVSGSGFGRLRRAGGSALPVTRRHSFSSWTRRPASSRSTRRMFRSRSSSFSRSARARAFSASAAATARARSLSVGSGPAGRAGLRFRARFPGAPPRPGA